MLFLPVPGPAQCLWLKLLDQFKSIYGCTREYKQHIAALIREAITPPVLDLQGNPHENRAQTCRSYPDSTEHPSFGVPTNCSKQSSSNPTYTYYAIQYTDLGFSPSGAESLKETIYHAHIPLRLRSLRPCQR